MRTNAAWILASLLIVAGAAGCSLGANDRVSTAVAEPVPGTTRADRPARYTTCPETDVVPPTSMVLVDRELPNLGDGVLGRIESYHETGDAPTRTLQIAVGVDVLDQFDDLDFITETVDVGDHRATVSTASAFGLPDQLVVLTWTEPDPIPTCAPHALVGSNISAQDLLALVS